MNKFSGIDLHSNNSVVVVSDVAANSDASDRSHWGVPTLMIWLFLE